MSDAQHYDLIIVGGGAAGLTTAIFAARSAPSRRIVLLDGARKLGAKILISGGGRCNVTNVRIRPEDFCGGSRNIVRRVLSAFPGNATVEFFREIGVTLHEEQWGKLFPDSNSAKTVLNALVRDAEKLGVELRPGHRVVGLEREADGFLVTAELPFSYARLSPPASPAAPQPIPHAVFRAPRVVLATGGQSFPKTGSDGFGFELAQGLGHTIVPPTPALAPLILDDDFHMPLSGIAQEVELTITANGEKSVRIIGPMLWTHFGVSGPAALDASRYWLRATLARKAPSIRVNFLPGSDFPAAEQQVLALIQEQPRALARNALAKLSARSHVAAEHEQHKAMNGPEDSRRGDSGSGWTWQPGEQRGISKRLIEALVAWAGVPPDRPAGQLTRDERRRITHALIEWPMPVRDSRGFNYAEATAGGVELTEIDPAAMESRVCPGLYLVGELLDVDGRIGGFNFQWAWSSAFVAGTSAGSQLARDRAQGE